MNIRKILIVEDNHFYGNLLKTKLEKLSNAKIFFVEKGEEVINITNIQPDLIFLDYRLGNMNGIDVLKEVKSTYPDIHVVMLSGQENITVAVDSMKYGATDYLIKGKDDDDDGLLRILNDCELSRPQRKEQEGD
ncbi:response regulator [Crocinitomix catalasitica]|nr:response regulator [Crocinitomix catalasitica]